MSVKEITIFKCDRCGKEELRGVPYKETRIPICWEERVVPFPAKYSQLYSTEYRKALLCDICAKEHKELTEKADQEMMHWYANNSNVSGDGDE